MPKISAPTIKEHAARRRQSILAVAEGLLMSRGYDGFTIADIAKAVGLSRTSMYKYFKDKDAVLVAALWPRVEKGLRDRQAEVLAHGDPRDRFAAWIKSTVGLYDSPDGRLMDLVLQVPLAQDDLRHRITTLMAPLIGQIQADFVALAEGTGLTPAMWVSIFEMSQRAAGRYARDRKRSAAVAAEIIKAASALMMTRFTSDGLIAGHKPDLLVSDACAFEGAPLLVAS